jgi:hypothetical protein
MLINIHWIGLNSIIITFIFVVFCHRPDAGSLKLKPVAWLRVASVVGCDCTSDKSKIHFCMYTPTGMSNIKIVVVGADTLVVNTNKMLVLTQPLPLASSELC